MCRSEEVVCWPGLIKMGNEKILWRKHHFVTQVSGDSCPKAVTLAVFLTPEQTFPNFPLLV